MNFEEYADRYVSAKKQELRPQTMAAYRLRLRPLYENFGKYELVDITIPMMRDYVKSRCEFRAPKTVRNEMTLFRSILQSAAEEGYRSALPKFNLYYPQAEHKYKLLGNDDFQKLYNYCCQHHDYVCTGILIELNTGMRIGELCALKKSDIDFKRGVITVNKTAATWTDPDTHEYHCEVGQTKTPSGRREVYIRQQFAAMLESRLEKKKDSEYVLGFAGKHADPSGLRFAYNRLLEKLGIEHIK